MIRWAVCVALWGTWASAAVPVPYSRSVNLVEERYMYPEDVTPEALLREAARYLERRIDWLFADVEDGQVTLRHGRGDVLGSVEVTGWDDLAAALHGLETTVLSAGQPMGDLDLRLAVLGGMTQALDRYTRVLAGERLTSFDTRLKGTLVGIGATLGIRDDQLTVITTIPDGPAELGGLLPRDRIARIDGVSTVNITVKEAVRRIRGEKGSTLVLDLVRPSEEEGGESSELRVELVRDKVIIQNVHHKVLEDGVGWVRIDSVSQRTVYNLGKALESLAEAGALDVGLVLDVRGNTGGSMRDSAGVVDALTSEGNILTTVGPDGEPVHNLLSRINARPGSNEPAVPVAVLVDKRTASGAEIISGALKGLGRAVVIGERTFGKGEVQQTFTLEDGVRLKITVAEYQVAEGVSVAGQGVQADRVVSRVLFDELGARFIGWDTDREGVDLSDIVPMVDEREAWRGVTEPAWVDVPLEAARRAVRDTAGPSREQVLDALDKTLADLGGVQQTYLEELFAVRGIDWSAAEEPGAAPEVDVSVTVRHDKEEPNVHIVEATVQNHGPSTLRRTLVRLESEDFSGWNGLYVPVGAVPSGETVSGEVRVRMRSGVSARRDLVSASLWSDKRPSVTLPSFMLDAEGTPLPRLRAEASLVQDDDGQAVQVKLRNLSTETLEGVEIGLAYAADADIELTERAVRLPTLKGRESVQVRLGVKVGAEAPPVLPMGLDVQATGLSRLEHWDVDLRRDGLVVVREAPRIEAKRRHLAAPVGSYVLPIQVTDDTGLGDVVVFVNERKVLWQHAGVPRLDLRPSLELAEGVNEVTVIAVDDDNERTKRTFRVFGTTEATDAEPPAR